MFLNFSNHASENWGEEQSAAAGKYGKIVDFPFPQVDSKASTEEINASGMCLMSGRILSVLSGDHRTETGRNQSGGSLQ